MDERPRPTIDLAGLYEDRKVDQSELDDFIAIQHFLSDRHAALPHLQALNAELVEAEQKLPLPEEPLAARALRANELLHLVLGAHERECDFAAEQPVLGGFASADDFRTLTKTGRHFYDTGAGLPHGQMTHRIQWYLIAREVTGGTFKGPVHPYHHTPRQLFAASMSDAYQVPAVSLTKKGYMWDWIVDRISGMTPGEKYAPVMNYMGERDGWTHPGETGAVGALSNDILNPELLDKIDLLRALRQAQIDGNRQQDENDRADAALKRWFALAVALNAAEGTSPPEAGPTTPTYFYLPGPAMVDVLVKHRQRAQQLVRQSRVWTRSAMGPQDAATMLREVHQVWEDADTDLHRLTKGTEQRLAPAILGAWQSPVIAAFTVAANAKGADEWNSATKGVVDACAEVEKSPAWTFPLQ